MAEAKTPKAKKEAEYMDVLIPRDASDTSPNYDVCVNGIRYIMPRGEVAHLPVAVAKEILRSEKEKNNLYKKMSEMAAKVKA